ncbi:hypothetical protein SISSUDRAFT_1065934 [Sistotremastrum suecicum HHB10207 ss-3]|uniref:Uncharacterized protein n=1 Tax=Sistotremastrum suecicum HHB10207 ss-3 TaxID=1314776 RepID=A0A165YX08_9AGAM|nr:hypothetical protein SISSUDRAFT_1065934 [Sistotremastrum suecicum HHB10207 ss-3]
MHRPTWTLPSIEFAFATRKWAPQFQSSIRRHPVFFRAPEYQEPEVIEPSDTLLYPDTPLLKPPAGLENMASMSMLDLSQTLHAPDARSAHSESAMAPEYTRAAQALSARPQQENIPQVTSLLLFMSRYIGDRQSEDP